jgi:hypothetical protein
MLPQTAVVAPSAGNRKPDFSPENKRDEPANTRRVK